jgi:REP element-mobilizing transposase RayT
MLNQDGARLATPPPRAPHLGRPSARCRPQAHPGTPPRRPAPGPAAAHPGAPLHVTFRVGRAVRCLRSERLFAFVRRALAASSHNDFRILHYSVQDDHLHLIVEANDTRSLGRSLHGLAIRVAREVNRALGRRGSVWGDRYHARALSSPRAVRHALVYVLMNFRKHRGGERGLDPCSSALWFDGWCKPVRIAHGSPPVVPARTWLAAVGWCRHGLLGIDERPAGDRGRRREAEPAQ